MEPRSAEPRNPGPEPRIPNPPNPGIPDPDPESITSRSRFGIRTWVTSTQAREHYLAALAENGFNVEARNNLALLYLPSRDDRVKRSTSSAARLPSTRDTSRREAIWRWCSLAPVVRGSASGVACRPRARVPQRRSAGQLGSSRKDGPASRAGDGDPRARRWDLTQARRRSLQPRRRSTKSVPRWHSHSTTTTNS